MNSPFGPEKGSAEEQRWAPCAPGVLHQAAEVSLNRRRTLLKLIAGVTVLMALAGGGTAIGLRLANPQAGSKAAANPFLSGIACISVSDQMPNFLNGKLDDQVTEQITSHLIECADCRRNYTRLCCNSEPSCTSRPRKPKFKTTPCSSR